MTLALDRVQAIGVRTATVEKIQAGGSVRVTAAVEAPDQGRAEVHARSAGFVEAIAVRQEGVKVKAGQLLASIYSPELYQAQSELLAMQAFPASGPSAPPIEAARKRLELLGMGKGSIDAMLKSGKPSR